MIMTSNGTAVAVARRLTVNLHALRGTLRLALNSPRHRVFQSNGIDVHPWSRGISRKYSVRKSFFHGFVRRKHELSLSDPSADAN